MRAESSAALKPTHEINVTNCKMAFFTMKRQAVTTIAASMQS